MARDSSAGPEALEEIRAIGVQMETLVVNLLALARCDARQGRIHASGVSLRELAANAWSAVAATAREKGMAFRLDVPEELLLVTDRGEAGADPRQSLRERRRLRFSRIRGPVPGRDDGFWLRSERPQLDRRPRPRRSPPPLRSLLAQGRSSLGRPARGPRARPGGSPLRDSGSRESRTSRGWLLRDHVDRLNTRLNTRLDRAFIVP